MPQLEEQRRELDVRLAIVAAREEPIIVAQRRAGLVELDLTDAVDARADRRVVEPAPLDLAVHLGVKRGPPEPREHLLGGAPREIRRGRPRHEEHPLGQARRPVPDLLGRHQLQQRRPRDDVRARVRHREPDPREIAVSLDHPPERAPIDDDRPRLGGVQASFESHEIHARPAYQSRAPAGHLTVQRRPLSARESRSPPADSCAARSRCR